MARWSYNPLDSDGAFDILNGTVGTFLADIFEELFMTKNKSYLEKQYAFLWLMAKVGYLAWDDRFNSHLLKALKYLHYMLNNLIITDNEEGFREYSELIESLKEWIPKDFECDHINLNGDSTLWTCGLNNKCCEICGIIL